MTTTISEENGPMHEDAVTDPTPDPFEDFARRDLEAKGLEPEKAAEVVEDTYGEPKHTPGPWSVEGDDQTFIGAKDGREMVAEAFYDHVVGRWSRSLPEAQANARLIAACPMMYGALDEIVAEADNGHLPETGGVVLARTILDALETGGILP